MTAMQTTAAVATARWGRPDDLADTGEHALVQALRAGDRDAYLTMVRRYTPLMLRLARPYVPSGAAAEDVVQDTWVAVLRGIDCFQGRSSFKTWLLRILLNTARTRGVRERRMVCWSALGGDSSDWEQCLPAEQRTPETTALGGETRTMVEHAMQALPDRQRAVVVMRDVQGWAADEVCAELGISAGNQRVLLHRARIQLREALRPYVNQTALSA